MPLREQSPYIGFKSQEVSVSGKRELKIVLQEDSEALDEVVVVGYGVQKKSVVTASIAKVSSEDIAGKAPVRMDNACLLYTSPSPRD